VTLRVLSISGNQALDTATSTGRLEFLRDKYGNIVARVSFIDSRCTNPDKYGNLLGWYDEDTGWTRDGYGNPVGRSDLLTTLLDQRRQDCVPVVRLRPKLGKESRGRPRQP
jgi:hypothetical protein